MPQLRVSLRPPPQVPVSFLLGENNPVGPKALLVPLWGGPQPDKMTESWDNHPAGCQLWNRGPWGAGAQGLGGEVPARHTPPLAFLALKQNLGKQVQENIVG